MRSGRIVSPRLSESAEKTGPVPAVRVVAAETAASIPSAGIAANFTSPQDSPLIAEDIPVPFLSSAAVSQSWFESNKYILAALVVVAIVIVVFILLH